MNIILQILILLLIVATFSICAIKPDLHKNIIVYDSAYTLVPEEEVKTETNEVPVMEMPSAPILKTTVVEKKVEPQTQTINVQTNNVKKQSQTKPKQTTIVKQTVTKPNIQQETKPLTKTASKLPVMETKKIEPSKVEQKVEIKTIEQPKVMTQQEETIAWNKWRSALTNQIMRDTKLPDIPNGTLFQFSFNVDKYGKITNVQTGAVPSNYTPYAIQYIAPVIRSYQGRSILNFPEGTARFSTTVTGKWRISNTERLSTENDYNDIERVKKY